MSDVKSRILSSIGREAAPIHKVAKEAGVSLATASKYCYILQAEKKIDIASYGNMKLVRRKS